MCRCVETRHLASSSHSPVDVELSLRGIVPIFKFKKRHEHDHVLWNILLAMRYILTPFFTRGGLNDFCIRLHFYPGIWHAYFKV
jgi:hypothetical protein